MAENENEKFSVDKDQLKNETKETVNQVKDTIKNVDLKNDAKETTGYIKGMITDPVAETIKVANEEENVFKKSIIIMLVFIAASIASSIISLIKYGKYSGIGNNILDLVSGVTYPIFYICVPAILVLVLNKNNKKSLTTIISTLVVSHVPTVAATVIGLVRTLVPKLAIIITPINTGLGAITSILTYFGMKALFGKEEHKDFLKIYVAITVIAQVVFMILSDLHIY